ncbi:MAG: hypothetical protein O9264_11695 [Leptospira sp.]|nr:hypothetical protein [Leptospira sp.]
MQRCILISVYCLFTLSLMGESVLDRFSLDTDFKIRPSFYATDSPFFVNRSKHIYIGKTMNSDVQGVHLYDTKSKTKTFLSPPIDDYFLKHPELLIQGTEKLKVERLPVYISDLLFYDEQIGKMGIFIEHNHYQLTGNKSFFAVWDLEKNEISFLKELRSDLLKDSPSYSIILPIGFDEKKDAAYFTFATDLDMKNKSASDVKIEVFRFVDDNLEVIQSYMSNRFPYHPVAHWEQGKILIQSYAEIHEAPSPNGRLIDISSGEGITVSVPVVPYGATFSKDGKLLYLASSQTGELSVLDANKGTQIKKLKLGTHGHTMGFWKENELIWVRNSGVHIYDAQTLKQKKLIPTSKYFKGHVNVAGSLVLPYQYLIIRNSFEGPGSAVGYLFLSPD